VILRCQWPSAHSADRRHQICQLRLQSLGNRPNFCRLQNFPSTFSALQVIHQVIYRDRDVVYDFLKIILGHALGVSLLPILIAKVPHHGARLHWRMTILGGPFVLRYVVRQDTTFDADMFRQPFVQRGDEHQLHSSVHVLQLPRHGSNAPCLLAIVLLIWRLDSRHFFFFQPGQCKR
jgi:hypothetical protein